MSVAEAMQLVDITETAIKAQSLDELARKVLSRVAAMAQSSSAFLFVADGRLPSPRLYQTGQGSSVAPYVEKLFETHLRKEDSAWELVPFPGPSGGEDSPRNLFILPLLYEEVKLGLIGLVRDEALPENQTGLYGRLMDVLSRTITLLVERDRKEKELAHLNTYLTVSSMLAQSLSLQDMLEVALYSCTNAVSAEAASVLLVDEENRNFQFYQVEGPSKDVLMTQTVPLDSGLAGAVLENQIAEIINDVQNDPRFYSKIDSKSGFKTRNLIALPLTAGDERIGVLEVLNKMEDKPFTDEDRLLLTSIAEEIAFALRNAKVFDFVVSSFRRRNENQSIPGDIQNTLGFWSSDRKKLKKPD